MADLSDKIETAASGKSVTTDGLTVTQQDLSQIIEADRYLKAQDGAANRHRGLRFTRLVPPGSA